MTPAIVAVVAMYAAFLVVGWVASRRIKQGTPADLMLAGRQMPLIVAALTMTATWVDGGYLLGTAEAAYKSSIQLGIQGGVCFGFSLIVGGVVFAGIMRRFGFTTLIDPFEARFGKTWAAVLSLPALAVVPHSRPCAGTLGAGRRAHDGVHRPAAADWRGGAELSVAGGDAQSPAARSGRDPADRVRRGRAARHRDPWARGDCR